MTLMASRSLTLTSLDRDATTGLRQHPGSGQPGLSALHSGAGMGDNELKAATAVGFFRWDTAIPHFLQGWLYKELT